MNSVDPYESQKFLDEYLLFHYADPCDYLPDSLQKNPDLQIPFPQSTANFLSSHLQQPSRILDLGCAVGASSLHLAAMGHEVTGLDYSHRFIQAATELSRGIHWNVSYQEEGNVQKHLSIATTPLKVNFVTGDAMHLPSDWKDFDAVHAANLLCRLPEPQLLLQRLPALLKAGGLLLLTTPCTWLQEFTPPENWPKGTTEGWLMESLHPHFQLLEKAETPFVIREHARKYQYSFALTTLWQKRFAPDER